MKLTPQLLKRLVRETVRENKMILTESIGQNYDALMNSLEFEDGEVSTFGIMSGQNPMKVASLTPEENEQKAVDLSAELDSRYGPDGHVPIGGMYGNPEKSNVIANPTQREMEELCEKFKQESYVWGDVSDEPPYRLMVVNYDSNGRAMGSSLYGGSMPTDVILKDDVMQGATDNYSELDGKKFGFPFFGMPEEDTDEEV